jgi:hypothetical protein
MIRPHVPLATRYVDFGKVFVPNGALDFSALAASDPEVARYGPLFFNRGLLFPEASPFAAQIGAVTAALLMFEGGYLFCLVQRRREGELSAPGSARTDRPFNQVRFVLFNREQLAQAFAARVALYSGLALAARDPQARVWLKDYTAGLEHLDWSPRLERLDPHAPDPELVRFVANAVVGAAAPEPAQPGHPARPPTPRPISVPLPGGDLLARLQLVEAVQYWLLPRLGVLTFAVDYASNQNVHLRLFELPADAPAPLPPERVFVPGRDQTRLPDEFSSLSALAHEALYDEALPGLLALPVNTSEAVRLYQVEKQGQPLLPAEALSLYPRLAGLGDRRLLLLRRLAPDDVLALLGQSELPDGMRHDLLQVAFDLAHGMLPLYAPAHLALPEPARSDERVRQLLRASVARSPDAALDQGPPEQQPVLLRDILLARHAAPGAGRVAASPSAALTLASGQPLLEVLLRHHRGPALSEAVAQAAAADRALFAEGLEVFDKAPDLPGLIWLWRSAGANDFTRYCAVLERAVQPAWYAELASRSALWHELLAEGRTLAGAANPDPAAAGCLLRALPGGLAPFVWQASLATASHDAAFAEWWLFNEALALPEQLPGLWEAIDRLPPGALPAAGPRLNFMLGRAAGMSLVQACTPDGAGAPDAALFATVLRAWQAAGFRSPVGDLLLATQDVQLLIDHLPASNDLLAAVAAAPAQAPAVRGLAAAGALRWASGASGERRAPYRQGQIDWLFKRLTELDAPDEALLWHLLVRDESSSAAAMAWPAYQALVTRCAQLAAPLNLPAGSRVPAYLDLARRLPDASLAETFSQHNIDIRQLLALLAAPADGPDGAAPDPLDHLLPLAVFHLQVGAGALPEREALQEQAAVLLRVGLQSPEVTGRLKPLPDMVLTYLRQNFFDQQPGLMPLAHWIDAELLRRSNALRPQKPAQAARPGPAGNGAAGGRLPVEAPPAESEPAAPAAPATDPQTSPEPEPQPEPQPALPGAAHRRRGLDPAVLMWALLVLIALLICGVLIAAALWIQSLQPAAALLLT